MIQKYNSFRSPVLRITSITTKKIFIKKLRQQQQAIATTKKANNKTITPKFRITNQLNKLSQYDTLIFE